MVRIILIIMLIDSGMREFKPLKKQEQKFLFNALLWKSVRGGSEPESPLSE